MFKNSLEPKSLKPVRASCADCFIYSCFVFFSCFFPSRVIFAPVLAHFQTYSILSA